MKITIMPAVVTAALMLPVSPGFTQDLSIYPAQDQSAEQMDKDKYEC